MGNHQTIYEKTQAKLRLETQPPKIKPYVPSGNDPLIIDPKLPTEVDDHISTITLTLA